MLIAHAVLGTGYSMFDVTATDAEDQDYVGTSGLIGLAGDNREMTVSVTVLDDSAVGPDETVVLQFAKAENVMLPEKGTVGVGGDPEHESETFSTGSGISSMKERALNID